ncbi:MAG: FISUMP domain-containing protein [Flavobacteriales bacterium]
MRYVLLCFAACAMHPSLAQFDTLITSGRMYLDVNLSETELVPDTNQITDKVYVDWVSHFPDSERATDKVYLRSPLDANPCEGIESVTYNSVEYRVVAMNGQCWFADPLMTESYRDGSAIPEVTDNAAWVGVTTGAWCHAENDPANDEQFGYFYHWTAVTDSRGLCPTGWKVPDQDDVAAFDESLSQPYATECASEREDLFSADPGGYREGAAGPNIGKFYMGGPKYWTTGNPDYPSYGELFHASCSWFQQSLVSARAGLPIRCLKE